MAKYTVVSVSLGEADEKQYLNVKKAGFGPIEIFRAGLKFLLKKAK